MAQTIEFQRKALEEHLAAATIAEEVQDDVIAYQNFYRANEDLKNIAELEIDKQKADLDLEEGEKYRKKAEECLARLHLSPEEAEKITPTKPVKGFAEFVGYEAVKDYLREDVLLPWQKGTFSSRPKNLLFLYGPKGCGKETFVRALTHEMHASLFPIRPIENFSIYNLVDAKDKLMTLFKKAEEKGHVVLYFTEPEFYFPKETDKEKAKICKFFRKIVQKEWKRIRKKNLPIFLMAVSDNPWLVSTSLFVPGLFDDLIRIHHPGHETRREMIEERLSDCIIDSPATEDYIVEKTHGLVSKDVSRMIRSIKKMAALYAKKEAKPVVTKVIVDKVLSDFESSGDGGFAESVIGFESSLPAGLSILHQNPKRPKA